MSATTYLAKPALCAILILKGPPSTIPCESQSHVNENTWWCVACVRQETRLQQGTQHCGYHRGYLN